MDLEIVTVGTELVLGHTLDTNAAYLARTLAGVGGRVTRTTSVADDDGAIADAVGGGLARTGFVITSGGLGPTRDDRTKQVVAELYGVPLVIDAGYLRRLEERWRRSGRSGPMPEANRTQAQYPAGAAVLANPRGSAPGLWLEGDRGIVVMLPGVPHELRGLTDEEVLPRIAARHPGAGVTRSCTLRTTGMAESQLADLLGPVEADLLPVTLAYLPSFDGVDLRLTAWRTPAADAQRALDRAAERLRSLLGDRCYGRDETDLAAVVLERARAAGVRIAVAESCTGGLVGGRLTAVPGSSAVFVGGVIAYADAVKVRDLDVATETLEAEGAVSEAVVRAMAAGAQRRFGAEAAIAVSGIAGPEGGSDAKPVGTVWLCAAVGEAQRTARVGLPGDRSAIRGRAAQAALDLLRRMLPPAVPGGR